MRKSRLFSLLCAFWPGAGEMYLGLMKRGIGIMILFWFALAIGATMFPWIIFIMPVLWFYSFFDTLTLRNLDYYALTELQERDEFFFQELLGGRFTLGDMVGKYHVALGIGLICAGLLSIYNRLLHWFWRNDILPLWLADFLDYLGYRLLRPGRPLLRRHRPGGVAGAGQADARRQGGGLPPVRGAGGQQKGEAP